MSSRIKAAILVRFMAACTFMVLIAVFQLNAVFSALIGVIACFVPESYQGWKLSKTENEFEPSKWLRLTYQSIVAKWLMTAVIFGISFSSSFQWDYKILFVGYLVVNISGLLTPILVGKK